MDRETLLRLKPYIVKVEINGKIRLVTIPPRDEPETLSCSSCGEPREEAYRVAGADVCAECAREE